MILERWETNGVSPTIASVYCLKGFSRLCFGDGESKWNAEWTALSPARPRKSVFQQTTMNYYCVKKFY